MTLANKITILRILLVPIFISCFIYYTPELDFLRYIALLVFTVSVLSDAVDGYVARRFYQKTVLGTFLDPIADKILIISAYISMSVITVLPQEIRIPPWVSIIVISRDILIILGSVIIHITTGKLKISPNILGKLTTALQMITVIFVLMKFKYSYIVWNTAAIFTIFSGLSYFIRANRILNEEQS